MFCSENFYRSLLCPQQQLIYDLLLRGWQSGHTTVTLPGRITDTDMLQAVVYSVILDHPELFWVNYTCFTLCPRGIFTRFSLSFYFCGTRKGQLQQELYRLCLQVIRQIPSHCSEEDRIWLLYDYLARQVTYGGDRDYYRHTVLGPMTRQVHQSVCEGIAKSFKLLCDLAGLNCIVIFGKIDDGHGVLLPHAWNLVSCGGVCRYLDVTSELQNAHTSGMARRRGFLLKDGELRGYQWDRKQLPVCR